jgi:hypothetical protein
MHFIEAVIRYRMPYHKGNENIREEMATSGIHIMITKVSKEMATTFGRNV